MKNLIVRFLKWALSLFEPKPTLKEVLVATPTEEPKTKPRVRKATTRPVKKAPAAIKTAAKKKAK